MRTVRTATTARRPATHPIVALHHRPRLDGFADVDEAVTLEEWHRARDRERPVHVVAPHVSQREAA